ncbi:MAG: hypothetical protein DMG15_11075 [Acidobacteria bacterium]|nr:MAG: hypothetical protein DMG15_11075 [Acidobacteriota bacterium]
MIFLLAAILLTSGQIGVRNDLNEQMPQPLPPSAEYMPVFSYPLARNLPDSVEYRKPGSAISARSRKPPDHRTTLADGQNGRDAVRECS